MLKRLTPKDRETQFTKTFDGLEITTGEEITAEDATRLKSVGLEYQTNRPAAKGRKTYVFKRK